AAPKKFPGARPNPPPYEDKWTTINNPTLCAGCHTQIFQQWNGSMMANSWRDPGWRGAFFLLSRMTATNGDCSIPTPPDGTPKAHLNPFANADCSSAFHLETTTHTTTNAGSLLDDFSSASETSPYHNAYWLTSDTGTRTHHQNSLGQPQYHDRDGDGDLFDDAFLVDTRLQPLPHAGATVHLDRYAVVIPPGTGGPVAVTA